MDSKVKQVRTMLHTNSRFLFLSPKVVSGAVFEYALYFLYLKSLPIPTDIKQSTHTIMFVLKWGHWVEVLSGATTTTTAHSHFHSLFRLRSLFSELPSPNYPIKSIQGQLSAVATAILKKWSGSGSPARANCACGMSRGKRHSPVCECVCVCLVGDIVVSTLDIQFLF